MHLQKAKEILRIDNLSIKEKRAYETYIKNQRIHQSEITTVRTDVEYEYEKKLKEAKRQEEEAKQKLAKKMLKYGEPIEEIMKETGFTEDEIMKMKHL